MLPRSLASQILGFQVQRLKDRLLEHSGISLEISEQAKELLADLGFDPGYGARPLKRVIQKMVENPLALEILEGRFREDERVLVDTKDGKMVFEKQ